MLDTIYCAEACVCNLYDFHNHNHYQTNNKQIYRRSVEIPEASIMRIRLFRYFKIYTKCALQKITSPPFFGGDQAVLGQGLMLLTEWYMFWSRVHQWG